MSRRAILIFGALFLALSTGCRSSCSSRPGWFTAHTQGSAPCHLTSNATEGCFDPVTGQPLPCPPDSSILIPGGTAPPAVAPRPDELPYPSPGDMIPRQGVPYAPPAPAPGFGAASITPKAGSTVKGTPTKQ